MSIENIYDIDRIKEYNRVLEQAFKHIFYLIEDTVDNDAKKKLLREIKYIINSITRFEPIEDESTIVIDSNEISFSIIEWDGFYYYDSLNKKYNYYPECKSYYKMSRSINNYTLEVTRFDMKFIYTISHNKVLQEVKEKDEEINLSL